MQVESAGGGKINGGSKWQGTALARLSSLLSTPPSPPGLKEKRLSPTAKPLAPCGPVPLSTTDTAGPQRLDVIQINANNALLQMPCTWSSLLSFEAVSESVSTVMQLQSSSV